MVDGCNLFLTNKDYEQITESLNQKQICEIADTVSTAMDSFEKGMTHKITHILSDSKHPAHNVFVKYVLRNVAGNESIPETYKQALPKAIALIAKVDPKILGLVKPSVIRGQATSIDQPGKLGHRTRGAGFAYQLLGEASLISKPSKAKNTNSILKIDSSDSLSREIKLQASYSSLGSGLLSQPARKTTEADLKIDRGGLGTSKEIGIDFKHAMHSSTYSGQISNAEIDGRKVALMTGEIHEFHYVTNGSFSSSVKKAINDANEEIIKSCPELKNNLISYHENVK